MNRLRQRYLFLAVYATIASPECLYDVWQFYEGQGYCIEAAGTLRGFTPPTNVPMEESC